MPPRVVLVRRDSDCHVYAMATFRSSVLPGHLDPEEREGEALALLRRLEMAPCPFVLGVEFVLRNPQRVFVFFDACHTTTMREALPHGLWGEDQVRLWASEIATALWHGHDVVGLTFGGNCLGIHDIRIDGQGHVWIVPLAIGAMLAGCSSKRGCPEDDWYYLGAALSEMLTGTSHRTGDIAWDVSACCASFLEALLDGEPSRRLGDVGVRNHPWFSSVDWGAVVRREVTSTWNPPSWYRTTEDDPVLPEPDFSGFTYVRPPPEGNH